MQRMHLQELSAVRQAVIGELHRHISIQKRSIQVYSGGLVNLNEKYSKYFKPIYNLDWLCNMHDLSLPFRIDI